MPSPLWAILLKLAAFHTQLIFKACEPLQVNRILSHSLRPLFSFHAEKEYGASFTDRYLASFIIFLE